MSKVMMHFCAFMLLAFTMRSGVAQEVIPDLYKDPGLYPNRDYVNQNVSENIDPFTGSLQRQYVDLHIPGNGGFDLKVIRSYNSSSVEPLNPAAYDSSSGAGVGWSIHFGRVLKNKDTTICFNKNTQTVADNPVLELPDGSRQLLAFTGSASPLMLTTQRWRADCINSGGLRVFSPDGVQYEMTHLVNMTGGVNPIFAWFTTKIINRNGNNATIKYKASASSEISSIVTNDGRNIAFTYADSGARTPRLSQIRSAGQTWNYAYQAIPNVLYSYFLTSVTRPDGTAWKYAYNGNLNNLPGSHVMKNVTYPQGGIIKYTYDFVYFDNQANPLSRSTVVKSKSSSNGGNWSFAYTPGGLNKYDTTTATTPTGSIVYQHVGPNYSSSGTVWMVGLLISKKTGNTQTETYAWDKQKISSENYFRPGAFVTKVDSGETNAPILTKKTTVRDGATYAMTNSQFDSYGNPRTVVESGTSGGSKTTNISYYVNTSKWIINRPQNESFSGSAISRVFDGNGNMTSITEDGITTSYRYDAQGNMIAKTLPRSQVHSYSSFKRGISQSESQPESISITRQVDDAGNVTLETNGDGRSTKMKYDGLNRITSIDYPAGSSVSVAYTATTKTATRGALVERTVYNGFGQATSVTLGGIARKFTVDVLGRRTFESDPDSNAGTTYQFDILNRVTRISNADNTNSSISYGAGSKRVTDERGKVSIYTYRAYSNPDQQFLMGVSAPEASASVVITRNSKDMIASATQAGLTRSYKYNSNYYLESITNPETGVTKYGRDAAGNMTSSSVGSSATTRYAYDAQNRLTSISYPSGTPNVSQTYSKTHRLLTASSSTGNRIYTYDANGNMSSETLVVDGQTFKASYTYNALDQLASISYPSGTTVSYSPNVLGRPTQVSGYVRNVNYWPSGQIRQMNYSNGTSTEYNQNSRLWPSTFTTRRGGGAQYNNNSYSYDGVGNLTSICDSADADYNRTLGYDDINRLVTSNGSWGSGSVTYGGNGNITSQKFGSSTRSYNYDSNNKLTSTKNAGADFYYSYDAYGNIVVGDNKKYTYDNASNLICVDCDSQASKVVYAYDAQNNRSSIVKSGVKSYEFYNSSHNLLVEYSPAELHKATEYIYLGGKRVAQRVFQSKK
ncbi:YD repeat-containing protein [Comamonas sp. BIGb0152]|uniref:RHS repeat domain-containing protein n=1 Tax=Comamonas sp. BIGb0152 TaxID=2940601 RepID=UPI00216755C2|nr:hypothetical protein [Comamonas sp. BIGb0152]MCS4295487.1 YD repeat-containing protein [Comamonas sp. BIGb0152]